MQTKISNTMRRAPAAMRIIFFLLNFLPPDFGYSGGGPGIISEGAGEGHGAEPV